MKKEYDDCYAQIRNVSGDREIICFWRNNLKKDDFVKLESGNYCLIGEGEYNGLKVSYFIEFRADVYRNPGKADTRLPIEFRGHGSVKGIRLHVKKNSFPCSYTDRAGGVHMRVSWEGSYKQLSYMNEKERNIEKYKRKQSSA